MNFPKFGQSKLRGAALLLQIARIILEEPKRLGMHSWGNKYTGLSQSDLQGYNLPACGTVGCISGWAGFLVNGEVGLKNIGRELLGLTVEQAQRLFYVESWPEPFRSQYQSVDYSSKPNAPQIRANATVGVINLMVAELKAQNLKARRERYNAKRRASRFTGNYLSRKSLEAILRNTPAPVKDSDGNVIELTIDRRAHGKGNTGGALLNTTFNKMCCLGHLCFQTDTPLKHMEGKGWPKNVESKVNDVIYRQEATDIGQINDSTSILDAKREEKLIAKFAAKGITLRFIN